MGTKYYTYKGYQFKVDSKTNNNMIAFRVYIWDKNKNDWMYIWGSVSLDYKMKNFIKSLDFDLLIQKYMLLEKNK